MSEEVELTVMIPAYLEADSLRMLLPKVKAAALALTPEAEVLVIDSQQPLDDTQAVCAAAGVRHIARTGGNHYGDALRTGIAEAQGTYLLCMDADGSHNPSYFPALWAQRTVWDIVIGSRYAKGGRTENPQILIFLSWVVNVIFRTVFGIKAKDVTNSFRLYRRAVLLPLRLESNAFDILEELLIKLTVLRPETTIGEVPVTFERRKAGESKRKLLLFAAGYLFTLRRLQRFKQEAKMDREARGD